MFERTPRLGVVGGLIRDVDPHGAVVKVDEPGTFDWWLRGGRPPGPAPADGWPTFFFPEGGCVARRSAYLEVGGFFEPYFFGTSEVDLATRLLAAGWDVRYQPAAVFDHMKVITGRTGGGLMRRMRVRNQIWYFALRFPTSLAVRRIPAYLLFDFVECAWHGVLRDWLAGIREAWTKRGEIRGMRAPLPRDVLRRAELNRGRLHLRLLVLQLGLKLRRSR
jgi:GT2 family glycosyltransferase